MQIKRLKYCSIKKMLLKVNQNCCKKYCLVKFPMNM